MEAVDQDSGENANISYVVEGQASPFFSIRTEKITENEKTRTYGVITVLK